MRPLEEVQLSFIESVDDAAECLRWLGERRDWLGFDTETTGLRWWRPGFKATLAQIGDADQAWMFQPDRFGILLEKLSQYTGRIVGHNTSFDMHVLESLEYPLPDRRCLYDTLVMSKLMRANSYTHSLDALIQEYLGPEAAFAKHILDDAFDEWGFNKNTRDHELGERAWTEIARAGGAAFRLYSGMDCVSVARAAKIMWPTITELYETAYWREMGAMAVTWQAEHRGVRVDLEYAQQYDDELTREIQIVRSQLNELGVPNPSQRQKLANKLIDEGWIPQEYSKKSGKPKLDKRVLEGLDHEVVGPLLEWNRLTKWKTNYVGAVLKNQVGGRVFPSINVMEAKTHREAARTPPLHQIPGRHPDSGNVRRMFLPEEGQKMASVDYQAQELRITKHQTNDPVLAKIFEDNLDVHIVTAAAVYNVRYEDVTKAQRDFAKGFNYASSYGAQDPKLASMLGVSVPEVAAVRQRVNGAFVGIAAYNEEIIRQVEHMYADTGEAYITASDGRRCYIDVKFGRLQSHQALNYPKQMEGGIILKESKNRVAAAGLAEHLVLAIHDEHLISVPPGKDGEDIKHEYASAMALVDGEYSIDMSTSAGDLTDYWSGH